MVQARRIQHPMERFGRAAAGGTKRHPKTNSMLTKKSGWQSLNQHGFPDHDNPTWSSNPLNYFLRIAKYIVTFNHVITSVVGLRTCLAVSASNGHFKQACHMNQHRQRPSVLHTTHSPRVLIPSSAQTGVPVEGHLERQIRLRNEDLKKRVKTQAFPISSIRLWHAFSTF